MSHTIAAVSTGNVVSAIGIIRLTGGTFQNFTLVNGANSAYTDILGLLEENAYYTVDGTAVTVPAGTLKLTGTVKVEKAHRDHCVCVGALDHSCQAENWSAWESTTTLPTAAGNYYLVNDVTLAKAWDFTGGVI